MSQTKETSKKPEIPKSLVIGFLCGGALLFVFFLIAWFVGLDTGFYGMPPHAELLRSVDPQH